MSPLQFWNYLGLGCIRKRSFLGLGVGDFFGPQILHYTWHFVLIGPYTSFWCVKLNLNFSWVDTKASKILSWLQEFLHFGKIICYYFLHRNILFSLNLLTFETGCLSIEKISMILLVKLSGSWVDTQHHTKHKQWTMQS